MRTRKWMMCLALPLCAAACNGVKGGAPGTQAQTVQASQAMQSFGIAYFTVEKSATALDKDLGGVTVVGFDAAGAKQATMNAQLSADGYMTVNIDTNEGTWRAKSGMSYMHATNAGMFVTGIYDVSRQVKGSSQVDSFVAISNMRDTTPIDFTYILNGQMFAVAVDAVTAEKEAAYQQLFQQSGAANAVNAPEGKLMMAMLSEAGLKPYLPQALSAVTKDSTSPYHDHKSVALSCAAAASCAATGWGGILLCIPCLAAAADCGWGLGWESDSTCT